MAYMTNEEADEYLHLLERKEKGVELGEQGKRKV